MNELLTTYTSLPNLHPAVVHFPIALVPLAVLWDLGAAAVASWRSWMARAGAATWVLAALSAGLTYWAGEQAEDSLSGLDPRVQARISEHADWGLYTLWAVGILATARLGLAYWQPERRALLALSGALGLAATGVVVRTADFGGGLVYEHGVAVNRPQPQEASLSSVQPGGTPETEDEDPAARLETSPDGVVSWRPAAGDAAALGSILEPLGGGGNVTANPGPDPSSPGLTLELDGSTLLVLPGEHGDVQLDAELDLAGFTGVVGLAHHARGPGELGMFRLGPDDEVALVTLRPGADPKTLDRARKPLPASVVQAGVYAVGRHLRGILAGETVAHGHEPALPPGRVGLWLDGRGVVVVRSLTLTPIQDH